MINCDICGGEAKSKVQWGCVAESQSGNLCKDCIDEVWGQVAKQTHPVWIQLPLERVNNVKE